MRATSSASCRRRASTTSRSTTACARASTSAIPTSRSTASISSWSLTTPTTSSATWRSTGCPRSRRIGSRCPVRRRWMHSPAVRVPNRGASTRRVVWPSVRMVRSRSRTPATTGSSSSAPTGRTSASLGQAARDRANSTSPMASPSMPTGDFMWRTLQTASRSSMAARSTTNGADLSPPSTDRATSRSAATVRCMSSTRAGRASYGVRPMAAYRPSVRSATGMAS